MPPSRLSSRPLSNRRLRTVGQGSVTSDGGQGDKATKASVMNGQPLDLETIYRQHADAVAVWAKRMGGPGLDIEDIVHEVFLIAQRRLPEWRGDAKITTWLYEVTFRVVHDRRRRRRWLRWLPTRRGGDPFGGGDDLSQMAADQPGALELLERHESSTALYKILDDIGEKYRTVIILFELEGLSGEQIAALTGTSLANVWIRLYRGRRKAMKRFIAWETKEKP
jgi:RNA polymerase sigma-70 factor (ECF subfamily)